MSGDLASEEPRSARARACDRVLALAVVLPALLQLVGRRGEGALLVLAGLGLPFAVWSLGARPRPERASRVLCLALAACFAVPIVPTLFQIFGFSYERVLLEGALACLLWHGRLAARPSSSALPRVLRGLIWAWGAWSLGAALHALWSAWPPGAPWLGASLRAALCDLLGFRSMVEPMHALPRLSLRLEELLFARAALEVGLADARLPRRVALAFAAVLPLGPLVNAVAVTVGFTGNEHPWNVLLDSSLDRLSRPLPDHNALGSALVLMLFPAAFGAWRALRGEGGRARFLALFGIPCGLLLLVLTASKSAMAALLVGLVAGAALWIAGAAPRLRRPAVITAWTTLTLLLCVQLVPRAVVDELHERRYVRDVVKAARLDFVGSYLEDNRYPVWRSGAALVREAPFAGHGLGRFPLLLAEHYDPRSPGWFNPQHENAHNQYLQWLAEEGLVGCALGVLVLLLGILGCIAAARRSPSDEGLGPLASRCLSCSFAAGLCGLVLNLVVGHALLVPAVAGLAAGCIGVCVARASGSRLTRPEPASEPRRRGAVTLVPWLALAALGASPALTDERASLAEHELGCFPWLRTALTEGGVDLSRMLGPDARWLQTWGEGSRMFVLAKSIVPPHVEGGAQRLDVWLDGELVLDDFELPRKTPTEQVNPPAVLKLDAPEGVRAGDLVEVRIVCEPPYSESKAGGHSQSIVGARIWAPTFGEPQRMKSGDR